MLSWGILLVTRTLQCSNIHELVWINFYLSQDSIPLAHYCRNTQLYSNMGVLYLSKFITANVTLIYTFEFRKSDFLLTYKYCVAINVHCFDTVQLDEILHYWFFFNPCNIFSLWILSRKFMWNYISDMSSR
jgi:hypothetical protein